jgi:hypothetical protein
MDKQQLLDKLWQILDGIDRTETDRDGWWETSTGATFGAGVLRQIEDAFRE